MGPMVALGNGQVIDDLLITYHFFVVMCSGFVDETYIWTQIPRISPDDWPIRDGDLDMM